MTYIGAVLFAVGQAAFGFLLPASLGISASAWQTAPASPPVS
ncbi:PTS system [Cutibacterium acnes JCM 18918]|nr:PTS system [Cutibacterium acnes JCM 18918]